MKPISGMPPMWIMRWSTTSQRTKFISETVYDVPSALTDSTYATCPKLLSKLTMMAPTLGVWPVAQPYDCAWPNHCHAFPSHGTWRRLYTYHAQNPNEKRFPAATANHPPVESIV